VPLASLKARLLHQHAPFDGMWAMMTYMLFPLVFAKWLGVRVPYVLTLQDGDPYEKVFERWFIKPFTSILDYGFRKATLIQAISQYLSTWPKKRGYAGEVIIVRNGANPKNFNQYYSTEDLEKVKHDLGKKPQDIYLFIASRLVYQKGIDAIVRALPLLPNEVHFLIAGAGAEESLLKDLSRQLGVEERVRFLGALERDDVPKYRNPIVCDIFVHPSRSEGLGNSVLSSMAGRLPVIATQVGGLSDFVFDRTHNPEQAPTAWVVEPDQPEQIAKAVEDILTHPDKVKEVTQNARQLMETEYQWDAVAKRMREEVFEKLFNQCSSR
jgi:teichuronic acid biosynthesis glycosyltransferase TuaC